MLFQRSLKIIWVFSASSGGEPRKMPGGKKNTNKTTLKNEVSPSTPMPEGCISPEGCLAGTKIDPENPENAIQMLCSNGEKCTVKSLFIHPECMEYLEKQLWNVNKHNTNTARAGDAGAWFQKHASTVLWSKSQGYNKIYRFCRCPCGGYLRRDLNQNIPGSEEEGTRKPRKRNKTNSLSDAERNRTGSKPVMNQEGLGLGKTGGIRGFKQQPKSKSPAGLDEKVAHFWEQTPSEPKKFIVGMGKGKGNSEENTKSADLTCVDDSSSVCDWLSAADNFEENNSLLTDKESFFQSLRGLLATGGGRMGLGSRGFLSLLDRVEMPLSQQIFSLDMPFADWIQIHAPSDIYTTSDFVVLSSTSLGESKVEAEKQMENSENGWSTVGGRKKKRSESGWKQPETETDTRSKHRELRDILLRDEEKLEQYSQAHAQVMKLYDHVYSP